MFNPVPVIDDGTQQFAAETVGGRGRVTGVMAVGSGHHIGYLCTGQEASDGEMRSVIYRPLLNTGQVIGHMHRVRVNETGKYRGIVMSMAVDATDGNYDAYTCRAVRFDRTTLKSSAGDTPVTIGDNRSLPFRLATRIVGGSDTSAVVQIKRWLMREFEPDWGDDSVVSMEVRANADIPVIPGTKGKFGLWTGRMFNGSAVEFGEIRTRVL
jgi:hypothetical protein